MMNNDVGPVGPGGGRRRYDGWGDMHDHMDSGFGWGGWLLVVLLVLLLLALIAGVIALVAWSAHRSDVGSTPPSPGGGPGEAQSPALQMLDERFAFGDIDEEDYIRRRAVLRGW